MNIYQEYNFDYKNSLHNISLHTPLYCTLKRKYRRVYKFFHLLVLLHRNMSK